MIEKEMEKIYNYLKKEKSIEKLTGEVSAFARQNGMIEQLYNEYLRLYKEKQKLEEIIVQQDLEIQRLSKGS